MTSVKAAPMQFTVTRLGVALLCLLAAVQALAGCAEMSHEQEGAATGAGIGAVVGAVAGGLTDEKNPGRGALRPPQNNQIRVRELVLVQGTNEIQSSITLPPMPRTATTG